MRRILPGVSVALTILFALLEDRKRHRVRFPVLADPMELRIVVRRPFPLLVEEVAGEIVQEEQLAVGRRVFSQSL